MITYSYFQESNFWLKCNASMDDIQSQFQRRVTPMDAPIADQEFRGEFSQTDFSVIRRRGMFDKTTYARAVPRLHGEFLWYGGDLFVTVIIEPPAQVFRFAIRIGIMAVILALGLVVLGWGDTTSWIGAIIALLCGGVYLASIFAGWKGEVGYVINAIGEITDGEGAQDPRVSSMD